MRNRRRVSAPGVANVDTRMRPADANCWRSFCPARSRLHPFSSPTHTALTARVKSDTQPSVTAFILWATALRSGGLGAALAFASGAASAGAAVSVSAGAGTGALSFLPMAWSVFLLRGIGRGEEKEKNTRVWSRWRGRFFPSSSQPPPPVFSLRCFFVSRVTHIHIHHPAAACTAATHAAAASARVEGRPPQRQRAPRPRRGPSARRRPHPTARPRWWRMGGRTR